jgi:spore photoproduct lyase
MGCGFRCSYCFLLDTVYFRFHQDALMGLIFENVDDMVDEVRLWLENPVPSVLVAGELQDGLLLDGAYARKTGTPLTHRLVPLFAAQRRHRLLFLTKSVMIEHLLELPPTDRVLPTWSVNAEEVSARWEHGAPSPAERLAAASRVKAAGWPVSHPPLA